MRSMSFAATPDQIRNRTKTVTRRLGWEFLKPGGLVRAVRKSMGLKKGEKVEELAIIRITQVWRQPLAFMYHSEPLTLTCPAVELEKEGFPNMITTDFIEMFCRANKCKPDDIITRIEFEYVEERP